MRNVRATSLLVAVASAWLVVTACSAEHDSLAAEASGDAPGPAIVDATGAVHDVSASGDSGGLADGSPADATADARSPALPMGVLQFHVQHNLADQSCLARGDCGLVIEDEDDTAGWLAQLRAESSLAVLHWDRSIPWLVFRAAPPENLTQMVAFYDARLDPGLKAWIDAFAAHFAASPRGYLAVSLLDGSRDRLAALRYDEENPEIPLGGVCPDVGPETRVTVEVPARTTSEAGGEATRREEVPVMAAYEHFVRYLVARLRPDFLAILVEVNLFYENCPARWPDMVALYHTLYDDLRRALGDSLPIFATITLRDLLNYVPETCFGPLPFARCDGSVSADSYPPPEAETCYPLDATPIADLDEGDRLDILALSFYPDALMMQPPETPVEPIRVYAAGDGEQDLGACLYELPAAPYLDPFQQLDRLGWTKPMALAEWSSRSCRSWAWNTDEPEDLFVQTFETPGTQRFWLARGLEAARERGFAFAVYSFFRDYDVFGLWLTRGGVWDVWTFNVFNAWPCSGLFDGAGAPKGEVTELWRAALDAER